VSESLRQAALLAAAIGCSVLGFAWLAVTLEPHWQQVRGTPPLPPAQRRLLRVLGVLAFAISLALCLAADHPTMAVLVWVMSLASGALVVAFTLSWWPRGLSLAVVWIGRRVPRDPRD
jgi:hypothetical protein